jgi:hypothetical protein
MGKLSSICFAVEKFCRRWLRWLFVHPSILSIAETFSMPSIYGMKRLVCIQTFVLPIVSVV